MKALILTALFLLTIVGPAHTADGMITVLSSFSVQETTDRIESILNGKGMTVFNRIQHSQSASKIGIELRDTELIIFGNPKVGSPLMKCQQSVAIDLPHKALIWQDDDAKVWISYNDPRYLVKRHSINGCEEIISKIERALAGIVKSASVK